MNPSQQPAARGVERESVRGAIVALDVGERRIGVAVATQGVWLARPHGAVINDASVWDGLAGVVSEFSPTHIVVGLPRNLAGDDTPQTRYARDFAAEISRRFNAVMVDLQDEALTSRQAEDELRTRGRPYTKADIDALAATYILEDYIKDMQR